MAMRWKRLTALLGLILLGAFVFDHQTLVPHRLEGAVGLVYGSVLLAASRKMAERSRR